MGIELSEWHLLRSPLLIKEVGLNHELWVVLWHHVVDQLENVVWVFGIEDALLDILRRNFKFKPILLKVGLFVL